jgi:hypothetical protein
MVSEMAIKRASVMGRGVKQMDVKAKEFYDSIPPGRCKGCQYADVVRAQGNFMFLGCRHAPYKGKRVAEIKKCPKRGEEE